MQQHPENEWVECHGLDTPERVCFYEQDFYVLSNFSAFNLTWGDNTFATAEAAYHWEKFETQPSFATESLGYWRRDIRDAIQKQILRAPSAHEAFRIAQEARVFRHPEWDDIKTRTMKAILHAKVAQHEYVRRKLLATGDRELVENSWRDDFWGWGPDRDGQNMLGKLWMEVRSEIPGDAK